MNSLAAPAVRHALPAYADLVPAELASRQGEHASAWQTAAARRQLAAPDGDKRRLLERVAGLLLAIALHCAALCGLWSLCIIPSPQEAVTLFVDFIAPPAPPKAEEPKPVPHKPRPIEKPRQLVAATPVIAPAEYIAPPPPPAPVTEAPPAPAPAPVAETKPRPAPAPTGPVTLASELAVSCPERAAPSYPAQSRRFGEAGVVVLRVELNESGQVAAASVNSSSNYARLDQAALAAIRSWRCTPAMRNGQPVRAVALQPFNFVLQGN